MEKPMPIKSKKPVVKSAALANVIEKSLAALGTANDNGEKAVAALSATAKKLTAEGKRLSKKRATLSRRKKATTAKIKKTNDADAKKLLKATEKELNSIKKLAAKSSAAKKANAEELKGLKASAKRTKAYLAVIAKADKVLNKPKKKTRKKRAKKAAS